MKGYAKNSFYRFGDDLTELILQYLTFEDKVRLECVSKQWRRLVFNKQFVIDLRDQRFQQTKDSLIISYQSTSLSSDNYNSALISVLKKCPNIRKVIIDYGIDSSVLSLIGRYCPNIKSLTYYPSHAINDNVLSFFRMYGHKFEELDIKVNYGENEVIMKQILNFCSNVKSIKYRKLKTYFDNDINILPKLEHIKSVLKFSKQDLKFLKILSDKYSQTMKSLNITVRDMTAEELKTSIECIARFENLKELKLTIGYLKITQQIEDCLSLIGQKCNKLLKLDLSIDFEIPISNQFLEVFSEFKAIENLKIDISRETVLSGSVECFNDCKKLKHLDITYSELREDFFANIASFVPKLQSLKISTDEQFSDSFVNLFNSMKNIKTVELVYKDFTYRESIDKSMIRYFGKSLSEVMLSPNGMNVKHITHNCGLINYVINEVHNYKLGCITRIYNIEKGTSEETDPLTNSFYWFIPFSR